MEAMIKKARIMQNPCLTVNFPCLAWMGSAYVAAPVSGLLSAWDQKMHGCET
jgi:hypothetical protein